MVVVKPYTVYGVCTAVRVLRPGLGARAVTARYRGRARDVAVPRTGRSVGGRAGTGRETETVNEREKDAGETRAAETNPLPSGSSGNAPPPPARVDYVVYVCLTHRVRAQKPVGVV